MEFHQADKHPFPTAEIISFGHLHWQSQWHTKRRHGERLRKLFGSFLLVTECRLLSQQVMILLSETV